MAETFTDNREAGRFELDVEGHLAWADRRVHKSRFLRTANTSFSPSATASA